MFSLFSTQSFYVQSDFEGCADILTCDRPQQNVTIEPMMPYTNVDIFQKKGTKSFSKKSLAATKFYGKINHSRLFLLSFNSKLSHFDQNINLNLILNQKCLSPTWRKSIWSLICGEHSEVARQIYGEKLLL
jgi:hypothetical protein